MRLCSLFLAGCLALPLPASAQDFLESYVADIGVDDLYNSSGARLTQAWQIIRQDRANYHRFGIRDPLDEGDTFFNSLQNRGIAERMLRDGAISRNVANRIVNGNVAILVEIYGYGNTGTELHVSLY